jgi:hypothetical protein
MEAGEVSKPHPNLKKDQNWKTEQINQILVPKIKKRVLK